MLRFAPDLVGVNRVFPTKFLHVASDALVGADTPWYERRCQLPPRGPLQRTIAVLSARALNPNGKIGRDSHPIDLY